MQPRPPLEGLHNSKNMSLPAPRFSILMLALLVMAIVNPLLEEVGLVKAQILLNPSFTGMSLSGAYVLNQRKRRFFFVLVLSIVTIILSWFNESGGGRSVQFAFQPCRFHALRND